MDKICKLVKNLNNISITIEWSCRGRFCYIIYRLYIWMYVYQSVWNDIRSNFTAIDHYKPSRLTQANAIYITRSFVTYILVVNRSPPKTFPHPPISQIQILCNKRKKFYSNTQITNFAIANIYLTAIVK